MSSWRYLAVTADAPAQSEIADALGPPRAHSHVRTTPSRSRRDRSGHAGVRGEIAADSAADARAALRRLGLRVLEIHETRRSTSHRASTSALARLTRRIVDRHSRSRRRSRKAELFDALATMLEAGLALSDCVAAAAASRRGSDRAMLRGVLERLRSGHCFADAIAAQPSWFDEIEAASVRAGEHAGELIRVLRSLSQRHHDAAELDSRLTGVLVYPAVVACVAIGVVVFLSTRTLPPLAAILDQSGVAVPRLTRVVMRTGELFAAGWPAILAAAVLCAGGLPAAIECAARRRLRAPAALRAIMPVALRRLHLAHACASLAELLRAGVPLVESLRLLAPAAAGPAAASLAACLRDAADQLERGDDLTRALHDPFWFDDEFRRVLFTAQTAGSLPELLAHLAQRHLRSARRAIDSLTTLLEPAAILALAVLVGMVVLAAVLPMLKLQEIIR